MGKRHRRFMNPHGAVIGHRTLAPGSNGLSSGRGPIRTPDHKMDLPTPAPEPSPPPRPHTAHRATMHLSIALAAVIVMLFQASSGARTATRSPNTERAAPVVQADPGGDRRGHCSLSGQSLPSAKAQPAAPDRPAQLLPSSVEGPAPGSPGPTAPGSPGPTAPGSPGPTAPGSQPPAPPTTDEPTAPDVLTAPATAPTTTPPTTTTADLPARALALISYPWQETLPGWTIEFSPPRTGYRGLTFPAQRHIVIYVRADDDEASLAAVIAHELGHAVDVDVLDDHDRDRWLTARGRPVDYPWFPDAYATDFAVGAGDWAEAFATWQLGTRSNSTMAPALTGADLALVAELVLGSPAG